MAIEIKNAEQMNKLGQIIGSLLQGGEVLELVGDVGAGKTTLIKGIATGMGVEGDVQSPSFTISRVYGGRDDMTFIHYDFYRLDKSGLMANELAEVIGAPKTVVAIEWAKAVENVLPKDRLTIKLAPIEEGSRMITFSHGGVVSEKLEGSLSYDFTIKH